MRSGPIHIEKTVPLRWRNVLLVLLTATGLFSCNRVTIEVDKIPINTPEGASFFISGNFNLWDPGDGNFRMRKEKNGKYYQDLPLGWGVVEYKFTRGDWTTVEGDGCGHGIENRTAEVGHSWFHFFSNDTIRNRIYSWEDQGPTECDKVTFRIRKLPKETTKGDSIFLSGSFNDWKAGSKRYMFHKSEKDNFYYLDLAESNREIEFKITRGKWDKEEVDINGDRIPNRKFVFGNKDTVDLEIGGWVDLNPGIEPREITFLVNTPLGTPPGDPVYIVGTFNHWVPADPRYEMKKIAPNLFSIKIRKPEGEMEYKFTRGPWGMEEVDVFGNHISNRKLRTSADTVKISIPEWLDIPVNQTFTLNRDELNYIMNNPDVIGFPVNLGRGEKSVRFTLVPKINRPTFFYVRVGLPSAPNNRNYGLVDLVKPGQEFKIVAPEGAHFFACDGPYWNDNRPIERKAFTVTLDMEGKRINANSLLPPQ